MGNVAELTCLRFNLNIKEPESNSFTYFFFTVTCCIQTMKTGLVMYSGVEYLPRMFEALD